MYRSLLCIALCAACDKTTENAPADDTDAATEVLDHDAAVTVPIAGGTLAVSESGSFAAAADIAGDRVFLIDVASGTVAGTTPLSPGDQPGRLIVDDTGTVFAALRASGEVAQIDGVAGEVIGRTPACPSPRGLARDGNTVWLVCASGELVSLDGTTGARIDSVFVEYDLRDIVVDGDDLLISTFKRAELLTVDVNGSVRDRRVGQTFDESLLQVLSVDPFQYSPGGAWRTVPHPDGGAFMIHQRGSDKEITRPLNPSRTYYGPDPSSTLAPREGCSGLVHTAVTLFPPGGGAPVSSGIIGYAFLPVDGAVLPDGQYAVVAAAANDDLGQLALDIAVFDDSAFDVATTDCTFGHAVRIADDSQMTAIGFAPDGTQVSVGRSPFRVYVNGEEVDLQLPPDPDPEQTAFVDHGFDLFHKDAAVGMTCAACHLEGQDDGRTWIFLEVGARRTQSMAGGLGATAPFHWGGEFAHFNALMNEVLVNRMGHPSIDNDDVQALSFWMESLKPTPVTPMGSADEIARGHEIFHSVEVGCTACHSGEIYTANINADVGTGGLLQVPSLVGIGYRFPYMHDGCADTLHDRFGPCGGGDTHGKTSHLSAPDIDALVAYLQSL